MWQTFCLSNPIVLHLQSPFVTSVLLAGWRVAVRTAQVYQAGCLHWLNFNGPFCTLMYSLVQSCAVYLCHSRWHLAAKTWINIFIWNRTAHVSKVSCLKSGRQTSHREIVFLFWFTGHIKNVQSISWGQKKERNLPGFLSKLKKQNWALWVDPSVTLSRNTCFSAVIKAYWNWGGFLNNKIHPGRKTSQRFRSL